MINGIMTEIFHRHQRKLDFAKQQLDVHLPQIAILLCVGFSFNYFVKMYSKCLRSAAISHIILLSKRLPGRHFIACFSFVAIAIAHIYVYVYLCICTDGIE